MLNRKSFFAAFIFAVIAQAIWIACTPDKAVSRKSEIVFRLPVVIQEITKDTITLMKRDALRDVWFVFAGKHKFSDTLKLVENPEKDTTFFHDYIEGYYDVREGDTLNTDGFQIFVDYKTSIHKNNHFSGTYYYFPMYIVNETSNTKVFIAKDRHMFGIQEALDTTDNRGFYPIEHRGFDLCGNGYFSVLVRPGEFILGLIPKYKGNEEQKMRVRLKVGETIYFSPYYTGTFNREQFILKRDNWGFLSLKDCNTYTIQSKFYGAIPKGYKERGVN